MFNNRNPLTNTNKSVLGSGTYAHIIM
uniref:Uncharacterized protein n=1 Tax=Anguilla anguilla TaxID=7936 RepID=A0A0E9VSH7_ANGAN